MLLWLAQMIMTLNSMGQIRYEELAESARNPWWFQNQYIYDGVSTSVWWYGTQTLIYQIFGYTLFATKIFRLGLSLISLLALAFLLKKYLGTKLAILPLIVIGLSPTLLYFNTLMTSYGLDLQYLPILLLLCYFLDTKKFTTTLLLSIAYWSLAMIAWLSYPVFVYYLPLLAALYGWKIFRSDHRLVISLITVSSLAFVIPLMFMSVYFKNPDILYWDSTKQSGIFRGAGSFEFTSQTFFKNTIGFFYDLSESGNSYYYEVARGDFSQTYPLIALIVIFTLLIVPAINNPKYRPLVGILVLVFVANLLISSFTHDPSNRPGIRRYTPALAAIYGLFVLGWWYFNHHKWPNSWQRWLISLSFIAILLHHLVVFPTNLTALYTLSPYAERQWFQVAKTPDLSWRSAVEAIQVKDLQLGCQDEKQNFLNFCRYNEIYASIAGSCYWNNLNCYEVLGFDPKIKTFIPLEIDLWDSYYLEH